MSVIIDENKAIGLLVGVVRKRGLDFVYHKPSGSRCLYQHDGVPSCGVGQALFDAGVSIETLAVMDREDESGIGEFDVLTILYEAFVDISDDAVEVFLRFQNDQDDGASYGDALNSAMYKVES